MAAEIITPMAKGGNGSAFEPRQRADIRRELEANAALLAEAEAQAKLERTLRGVSASDFLRMKIKPREMLLDPILPEQGLAMLHGKRGFLANPPSAGNGRWRWERNGLSALESQGAATGFVC